MPRRPVFNNFHPNGAGRVLSLRRPCHRMRNVTGTSRRALPSEIESRGRRMRSYLRAFTRADAPAAGQHFKFQRRRVVYRGRRYHPEPHVSSTATAPSPRQVFLWSRGHPGAPRRSFSLKEPRRRSVCRCDFLRRGTSSWGPCLLRILILRVPVYHMSRVNSRCSAVLSNDMNIETLDVDTRRTKRSFSQ